MGYPLKRVPYTNPKRSRGMNLVQSSHIPQRGFESTEHRLSKRRSAEDRGRVRERDARGGGDVSRLGSARVARDARGARVAGGQEESRELAIAKDIRPARKTRSARDDHAHKGSRERVRGSEQVRKRSVGATSISASGARAIGLSRRDLERPHGRGETARRVGAASNDGVYARPAVYTQESEREGLSSQLHLPKLKMPRPDFSRFHWSLLVTPLMVVAIIALVIAMMSGPARTYYHAWRDAGRGKAEYDVLMEQNAELTHEVERLQTLEGIEDEARARGYVYPDEEALVVKGLKDDTVSDSERVRAALEAYEKSLPWYVGYLDSLFGYTHDEG